MTSARRSEPRPAPSDLVELAASARGRIDFLGRRSDAATLLQESRALAAGLSSAGLSPGERVAVFLPNVPTLLVALFACAQAGLRALLLDPREDDAVLVERLVASSPSLLLTQNPAPLFDKSLRLLPACPPNMPVVVGRFTDLLPFPRNLLAPLLRGGGLATLPPEPRFRAYADLCAGGTARVPVKSTDPPAVELSEGTLEAADLLRPLSESGKAKPWPEERLLVAASLTHGKALSCALYAFYEGSELLLSPRLDEASLERLAKQAKPSGLLQ